MRTRIGLVLALGLAPACSKPTPPAAPPEVASPAPVSAAPAAAAAQAAVAEATPAPAAGEWAAGTIHRGAPFTAATTTELSTVLGSPAKFAGQTVKTEGTVARACTKKGCWMELQTADGKDAAGMRVSFKDYAFFVPLDSQGARAVIEGTVEVKTLSKEEATHLEGEGAKVARNDKGEAVELAFVASGVELKR